MTIPVNIWIISLILSCVVIYWAVSAARRASGGDYNFAPAIIGAAALLWLVAWWSGVAIAWLLRG